jgi:two-component system LytT family response regulator
MMTTIRTVIIDDEAANRIFLDGLVKRYCAGIEIAGTAASADEGYRLINEVKPGLVFLDVKMPGKTGIDLLKMFDKIDFQVIFVSGFDQYAIQAFEFNAIDYILKPIDHSKLIIAVAKALDRIDAKSNHNIIHFIHSLDEKSQLIKNISLHLNDRVYVIDLDEICYISALKGYSEITTVNDQKIVSAKILSDYEELLGPTGNFIRLNKSVMINIRHIINYSKGASCFINVKNHKEEIEVSRRKKTEVIRFLKSRA